MLICLQQSGTMSEALGGGQEVWEWLGRMHINPTQRAKLLLIGGGVVSGEAKTKSITAALSYQPCSCLCRLFAREDSKHVVQIVGLQELQVDSVELLLEVTLPLLYHCSSLSTGEEFILLSSKYNGLRFS